MMNRMAVLHQFRELLGLCEIHPSALDPGGVRWTSLDASFARCLQFSWASGWISQYLDSIAVSLFIDDILVELTNTVSDGKI